MSLLILRSLWHRKLPNLTLIASIAVGAAIVFSAALLYKGVYAGMELSQKRMGADIVVIPGDAIVEPSLLLFGGAPINVYMKKNLIDSIRAIPGVRGATPQFFAHTIAGSSCCDAGIETRLIGFDPSTDWIISPWLKTDKKELSADEVIYGAKVEHDQETKARILDKTFAIAAIADETGTSLDYSLLINLEEARRLAKDNLWLKGIWEKYGPPDELISAIMIETNPNADINEISANIRQLGAVQVITAAAVKQKIKDEFALLVQLLGGLGLMTAALSLLQLFIRFYTLIQERQTEWGLYLALGASRTKVASCIIGEAAALSFTGSLSGLLLGELLYQKILSLMASFQSFPFTAPSLGYTAFIMFGITAIYAVLAIIAAYLPAIFASHTDPSIVMTQSKFD